MIDEKKLVEDFEEEFCSDCVKCNGSCRFVEIADIIRKQPKVGEWIPVEERLPVNEESMYWTIHEDGNLVMHCYKKEHGFIYNWETEFEKRKKQGCVVAWIEIAVPAPYDMRKKVE